MIAGVPGHRGERALVALVLAALGVAAAAPASAIPDGTTAVTCLAAHSSESDSDVFGPLPVGLSASCELVGTGYQGSSDVLTSLGPAIPRVGSVSASAEASSLGNYPIYAQAGGSVSFYFEIEELGAAPFAPATFPIYFEARGEGHLTEAYDADGLGSASSIFNAWAAVQSAGVLLGLQSVFSSETTGESFDESVVIQLAPNSAANPFYTVDLLASCQASAVGSFTESSATCIAVVDPLVRFDQATFDAVYGASSFPLADFYSIGFSENVPEPSAAALLGMAFAASWLAARRRPRGAGAL